MINHFNHPNETQLDSTINECIKINS